MALKFDSNTVKFDGPAVSADASVKKINMGFEMEAMRRGLSALSNRVLPVYGTAGNITSAQASLINGSTAGQLKTTLGIAYTIDGVLYNMAARDDILVAGSLDTGTQGTASTCFYLVSVGTNGTATAALGGPYISKGNDGITGSGAIGAANTTIPELPDCPDGHCAIGYMKVITTTAVWVPGTTTCANGGTFTITFVDLVHMPIVFGSE